MVFMPLLSRYKKLSQGPNPWISNEELLKYSFITLSLIILYGILIIFINVYFNLWSFHIITVCYIGPDHDKGQKVAFNVMTVLIPVIVSVIISCVMDLSCFVLIQHQRLSTTSNLINLDNLTEQPNISVSPNNIFNLFSKKSSVHPTPPNLNPQVNTMEIPLRATIISTLLFIPYITAYAVMDLYCMEIGLYWRHEWSKRERVSIYKVYLTSGFYERSEIKATREIYFIYTYE